MIVMRRSLRLLLLCGIAAAPFVARAGNRTLQTPARFLTGNTTPLAYIFAGDFTADGKPDVLVSDSLSFRVMPGSGTGTFGEAIVSDRAGYGPEGLADFNGDARPDLYLIGANGQIAVMFGAANGTFGAPVPVPSPVPAKQLVAGDFTGDGLPDLGLVANTQNVIVIFAGDGNGGFPSSQTFPVVTGGEVSDAVSGDFDGDGHLDVAFLTYISTASVAWNSGTSFTREPVADSRGTSAAAGDVNGDGITDLIASGYDGTYVTFGKAARGLTSSKPPGSRSPGGPVTVAAMDGDGRADFFVADFYLTLFTHDGTSFRTPHSFAGSEVPFASAAADFTGDGKTDVAVTPTINGQTFRDFFSMIPGKGDGTLACDPLFDIGNALGTAGWGGEAFLADLNGDAKLDLIASTYLHQTAAVLFGRGDGTFLAPIQTTLPSASYASMYDAGDLNGDGRTDLVLWDPGPVYETITFYVLFGQANGSFVTGAAQTTPNGTGTAARLLRALDYTGDGKTDLLDTGGRILPGLGNGAFGPAIETGINTWATTPSIADVNGDGRPDLLVPTSNTLRTYLNTGGGTFAAAVEGSRFGIQCTGDMNGDGFADLIESVINFSDGTGHYTAGGFGFDLTERCVTLDIDGDGKRDVATGTAIFFGAGDGTFDAAAQADVNNAGSSYGVISTADFDGNGSPDLWLLSFALLRITPTRMGGTGTTASAVAVSTSPNPGPYPSALRPVATVTGATVKPRGAVLFSYGSAPPSGLRLVGVSGTAKDTHPTYPVGSTTAITANFLGDEHYGPGSASSSHTIERGPSSITVKTNKNSYEVGQTIIITSTLGGNYGGSPTGTVTYRKGETVIATLPASTSQGQIFTDPVLFPVGTHVLTSSYSGDANFLPAESAPKTITINKVTPAMTLAITAGPLNDTQQVSLTASFPNQTDVTGFVSFTCFGQALGNVAVSNAQAVLTRTLPWGSGYCGASYGGSDQYATNYADQSVTVYHGAMPAAPLVSATAVPGGHLVNVAISPISGAYSYDIYGALDGGAWVVRGTSLSPDFNDYAGEATVAVYAALARSNTGTTTPIGPRDVVTFVAFTDDPLAASSTTVKAIHLTELQTAINAVRLAAGLTAATFATPTGTISAAHLTSLRQALTQARGALGLSTPVTDATITPGVTPVRSIHLQELRDAVK